MGEIGGIRDSAFGVFRRTHNTVSLKTITALRQRFPQLQHPVPIKRLGGTFLSLRGVTIKGGRRIETPASGIVEYKHGRLFLLICSCRDKRQKYEVIFRVMPAHAQDVIRGIEFIVQISGSGSKSFHTELKKGELFCVGSQSPCTEGIKELLGRGFPNIVFALTYLGDNRFIVESLSSRGVGVVLDMLEPPVIPEARIPGLIARGAKSLLNIIHFGMWKSVAVDIKAETAEGEKTAAKVFPVKISTEGEILGCTEMDAGGREHYELCVAYSPKIQRYSNDIIPPETTLTLNFNPTVPAIYKRILEGALNACWHLQNARNN